MKLWLSVSVIWLSVGGALGFSVGPGKSACSSLFPGHDLPSQTGRAPYSIHVSKSNIQPGEDVTVTLQSDNGTQFKGFLVQARDLQDNIQGVVSNVIQGKVMDCGGPNSASHNNVTPKNPISFTWTAPNCHGKQCDITFKGTVVENYDIFWVKISSDSVKII